MFDLSKHYHFHRLTAAIWAAYKIFIIRVKDLNKNQFSDNKLILKKSKIKFYFNSVKFNSIKISSFQDKQIQYDKFREN